MYIPNAAVDGVKFTDSVMLYGYLLNSIQILRYPSFHFCYSMLYF